MRWTKERPTKPGFYFFRDRIQTSGSTSVLHALQWDPQKTECVLYVVGTAYALAILPSAEFAGPIPEPEE